MHPYFPILYTPSTPSKLQVFDYRCGPHAKLLQVMAHSSDESIPTVLETG